MVQTLHLRRNGHPVGTFTRDDIGLVSFEYVPGYTGSPISYSLLHGARHTKSAPERWLKALLPEGLSFMTLCKTYGTTDWFTLLGQIGHDLPGDYALTPDLSMPTLTEPTSISDSLINDLITKSRSVDGAGLVLIPGQRLSLGGYQGKFSARITSSGWFESTFYYPSTHIIKPGSYKYPYLDILEHSLISFAGRIGVRASQTDTFMSETGPTFIATRFDRSPDGSKRIASEDFTQMMGYSSNQKYNYDSKLVVQKMRDLGFPESEILTWVAQVIYNTHVGNADAHLKNYSVFLDRKMVTPLYDCDPTLAYPGLSRHLAMRVGSSKIASVVTLDNWTHWGSKVGIADDVMTNLVTSIARPIRQNLPDYLLSQDVPEDFVRRIHSASAGVSKV